MHSDTLPTSTLDPTPGTTQASARGSFADVFLPDLGMLVDEPPQELEAGLGVEVDHGHAALAQPIHAALEGARLADHDGPDPELAHETAAVPARRERRDHHRVAVGAPAPGIAERVGLAVDGRVVVLDAAVVPAAQQRPVGMEERRADRDPALGAPGPRLLERDLQHLLVVDHRASVARAARIGFAGEAHPHRWTD